MESVKYKRGKVEINKLLSRNVIRRNHFITNQTKNKEGKIENNNEDDDKKYKKIVTRILFLPFPSYFSTFSIFLFPFCVDLSVYLLY